MTRSPLVFAALVVLGAAGPRAQQLRAAASGSPGPEGCFDGTGGPSGTFDWIVQQGELFFFDTTQTTVVGGPGGVPTSAQNVVGGVLDVRNLTIEDGGEVRVQGPNPLTIRATGDVVIRGKLDLSGFNAKNVATLNTGNQVEIGGAGAAGGGRGGLSNPVTTNSSPGGLPGNGPFGEVETGGAGGESAYAPFNLGKNARRPGGGGGGRFARDQGTAAGLAAGSGGNGHPSGHGAVTGESPAQGGAPGTGPFVDGRPGNDYFGLRPILGGQGELVSLLRGELPGLLAGYGGGGGGNAGRASEFPTPNWQTGSDEKGGAGGGGGGALWVQALGRIVFGANGQILARGGNGGTGENTNFLDHIGGTGGAGSGGHIVLETASCIDFTDGGANNQALARDWIDARGRPRLTGSTTYVDECCRLYSNGGASGPGVIQLHVPDPVSGPGTSSAQSDIVLPAGLVSARGPLDQVASPAAVALFPTCNPFPRGTLGWYGGAEQRILPRLAGRVWPEASAAPAAELDSDGLEYTLGLGLDVERLRLPQRP